MSSADNICKQFGPRSEPTEKKLILKKRESRSQQKYEKLPSMQRVKEGFDARAISAIRRRAVKCSAETAQLARTTSALFGYSCNKYLFLIGRFVTDVQPVKTQKGLTIRAFSQCLQCVRTQHLYTKVKNRSLLDSCVCMIKMPTCMCI